jgi:alpha-ketoglutarate-dependent taurine dioxygenase
MQYRPLHESFGLELTGIDIASDSGAVLRGTLSNLLMEHQVVVVRSQSLSNAQYAEFARDWTGDTRIDGFEEMTIRGFRDMNQVGNSGALFTTSEYRNGAAFWHTDCAAEADPNATTMLFCIHAPSVGGQTHFANLQAAYRALDDEMRAHIETLTGLHAYAGTRPVLAGREDWEHQVHPMTEDTVQQMPEPVRRPLVHVHPVTGRKGLYAPAGSMIEIEGVAKEEAVRLMQLLKAHATRPEFCYQHQWRRGDLLMWDNTTTLHAASPTEAARDDADRRLLYRMCPIGLPRHLKSH